MKRPMPLRPVPLPSPLVEAFRRMPQLAHNPDPETPFDIMRSQSAAWLVATAAACPEFRQALHDAAHDAGLIVYDRDNRTWGGGHRERTA